MGDWIEQKRRTRVAAAEAHEEGRHGDGTVPGVVDYWRVICADCAAIWHYEHREV